MITVLWEEQWLSTLQDLHSGKPPLHSCSPVESAAGGRLSWKMDIPTKELAYAPVDIVVFTTGSS